MVDDMAVDKKPKKGLARFTKVDDTTKNRIIAASYGEVGTGKTEFWLGAPGPIAIFSFDKGLEGVVEPYTKQKDIYVSEYEWAPAPGVALEQQDAIDLRERFTEDFEAVIQEVRTVFIDKETDLWNLFKFAEFGVTEKGAPQDWDSLKTRLRRLYNLPKALDINFGLIQGMKNEWVAGAVNQNTGKKGIKQTGERIRNGMDDVEGLVHINLFHERIAPGEEGNEDGTSSLFRINAGKVRGPGSKDVQDGQFDNLTFTEFAMLVFPDTTEEDWQ